MSALVRLWLVWLALLLGYQALVAVRLQPQRPDTVLAWTAADTDSHSLDDRPYLREPFLNQQVAWDSEWYLSIATAGYDDPLVRTIYLDPSLPPEPYFTKNVSPPPIAVPAQVGGWPSWIPRHYRAYSLNYAFFPLYPLVVRALRLPLLPLGLSPIATSTLAGVLVSALGALGGMLALRDMVRDELGEAGARRTAFSLLVFPTGFFLAAVLTEGLFVGLAFGSLALVRRRHWAGAALLAACAALTRATGAALFLPLAVAWLRSVEWRQLRFSPLSWREIGRGLLTLAPLAGFLIWRLTLGHASDMVQIGYFGRGKLQWGRSLDGWLFAFGEVFGSRNRALALACAALLLLALLVLRLVPGRALLARAPHVRQAVDVGLTFASLGLLGVWFVATVNPQRAAYYAIEVAATIFATVACFATLRRQLEASLFGLALLAISMLSAVPLGMPRYVLGVPSVFLLLGELGENEAFERLWSFGSTLLMGLLAALFSLKFWVS